MTNPTPESISERVRFWEEQDAINQELIPRVIRQHELLTEHIGEHDNLPAVVANAVQQAVAVAREEQQQQYETALETARRETRKMRDVFIGITAAIGAIAVAAALIAILVR